MESWLGCRYHPHVFQKNIWIQFREGAGTPDTEAKETLKGLPPHSGTDLRLKYVVLLPHSFFFFLFLFPLLNKDVSIVFQDNCTVRTQGLTKVSMQPMLAFFSLSLN